MIDLDLAVGLCRYARGDVALDQGGDLVVTHLAFGEQHDQRAALAVAHGMQLGVQPALGAPVTSANNPF